MIDPEAWKKDAACINRPLEWWFPEGRSGGTRHSTAKARAVCEICPVQQECLEYAVKNEIFHGMWGGMTPKQRCEQRRPEELRPVIVITHGTNGGYMKHWRLGEKPCADCREAHARAQVDQDRRKRSTPWDGPHGTMRGYRAGCRCMECARENYRIKKERRARRTAS